MEAVVAAGARTASGADAFGEMAGQSSQRLFLRDVGNVAVAVMVGILELGEGIVMRRALDARVVDADLLDGLEIIIDDHAAGADDGHLPDFARLEPAALDGGEALLAEGEGHVRDVLDAGGDVGVALAIDD